MPIDVTSTPALIGVSNRPECVGLKPVAIWRYAEVFFDTGPYAAGQARVRWAGCANRWNIDPVLIDRV